jgi:hypothetical protein
MLRTPFRCPLCGAVLPDRATFSREGALFHGLANNSATSPPVVARSSVVCVCIRASASGRLRQPSASGRLRQPSASGRLRQASASGRLRQASASGRLRRRLLGALPGVICGRWGHLVYAARRINSHSRPGGRGSCPEARAVAGRVARPPPEPSEVAAPALLSGSSWPASRPRASASAAAQRRRAAS